MSMESIGEEPGPVGEEEIASAQQLGRQVGAGDHRRGRGAPRPAGPGAGLRGGRGAHPHRGSARAWARRRCARSVARAFDLQFARVQCTADLLPADVVGVNVFNQREDRFEFRPGPIFANVVIVDEINRASPKTQSGLLECMQERRVTVDVHTHELARPFVVLATQNPIEFEGTYPLPEAQVDRFMARVSMGYPSSAGEVAMLRAHEVSDRVDVLEPVATAAELLAVQDAARRMHASDALRGYVVSLLHRTREDARAELGASPRAGPAAAARRQGARPAAGPRPRPARRRAGAGRGRARPPHRARARGGGRHAASASSPTRWRRRRRSRGSGMRPAAATALLGLLLTLTAATFDAEPLYVARRRPDGAGRGGGAVGRARRARGARRRARWARGARSRSSRSSSTSWSPAGGCRCPAGSSRTTCCPRRRRWSAGAGAPRCTSARASRGAGARCCRRRGSSSATRSASPPAW